ncbi:tumor necrosis factor receptor superfamily member 18 isoform X2 [Parambassis ranga]|uniref:Tumor necrosis factor receptor superfamily member 18 isoform X2 n=1 Tax=Parambassis ranga TaxID=210632 RepID=A0A6P7I9W9_9TELE|nr:tumor necrosis factor receptor superfamily member 9 isoform X2 [Parambassis ranga]
MEGTYMEEFCSKDHQTKCSPCKEGYFSDKEHIFDRCKPCRSCPQEYAVKCTPTTNANCSCRPGFLCSNSICSLCEENKCVIGDRPKRTVVSTKAEVREYAYQCEPRCPHKEYFKEKENICKPWTQCHELGLSERLPGNKTHNSVCERPAEERDSGNCVHIIVSIGLVLLSLIFLTILFNTCVKNLRKHKTIGYPTAANQDDFRLSKEESGHQLIHQDESKHSDNCGQLHLETVIAS